MDFFFFYLFVSCFSSTLLTVQIEVDFQAIPSYKDVTLMCNALVFFAVRIQYIQRLVDACNSSVTQPFDF